MIRSEVTADLKNHRFTIVSRSVVDASVPEYGKVRGALNEGRFTVEPGATPGTRRLTADMDVDPKGFVSRWLVNRFQKNRPLGMFRGLRRFIATKCARPPLDMDPLFEPMYR